MDQQRFDQLTRSLARDANRRGVLKGLAGAIAGALGIGAATTADARTRNPNGTICDSPRDCASGLCVDGVCCDSPCTGPCEACTSAGVCTPVQGAPVGNRGPCPGGGDVCGGVCDGVTTSHCAGYPGEETVCGDPSCSGEYRLNQVCSGNGLCIETATHCGLYPCAPDGGCLTTCAGDADCLGEAHCSNGVCLGDLFVGSACIGPDQCQSGQCVDGVCCDAACDGACQSRGADGFCADDPDDAVCDGGICCHGACVELGADDHCAACGDICVNGEACVNGECAVICTLELGETCESAAQCCGDDRGCAGVENPEEPECCIELGGDCSDGTGEFDSCCNVDVTPVRCGADGRCSDVGADCTLGEDCASGTCCRKYGSHYSVCCASGEICDDHDCVAAP